MTELEEITIEYEKLNADKARTAQAQLSELIQILSQSLAKNADQELTIANLTAHNESMQADAVKNTATIQLLNTRVQNLQSRLEAIENITALSDYEMSFKTFKAIRAHTRI